MTLHEQLADWLARKEKDYRKGVEIFSALKIDMAKVKYFNAPVPGTIHLSLLTRELENYARKKNIKPRISHGRKAVVQIEIKKEKSTAIKPEKRYTIILRTIKNFVESNLKIERP